MNRTKQETKGLVKARQKECKTPRPLFLMGMSFLVPILLLLPAFLYFHIFPFGDFTTLAVDLRYEYVGFFEALKNAWQDPGSLVYNFTKGLGGIMTGTLAYYLMDPCNLFLFFVPSKWVPLVVEGFQVLKVGFSGFFFSLYLIQCQHGKDWRVLLFSVLYALMSFSMANLLNVMWFTPIVLAPLVLLFHAKMMEGKNPIPYILLLAFEILTNFYIAYMLCLFLIFFTLWTLVQRERSPHLNHREWIRHQLRQYGLFVFYSVISGALAAWLLFPTIYSLLLSKGALQHEMRIAWEFASGLLDPFSRLIPATFNYDEVMSGYANIYSGTISVIMGIFYFFNHRIAWREKIISLFILAFLLLSTNVLFLNVLWHGMQYPVGYPYRFSWIFSLFTLILAFRSMVRMEKADILPIVGTLLFYGVLLIYLYRSISQDEDTFDFLSVTHLWLTGILVIAFLCLLGQLHRSRRLVPIMLLLLSFSEVSISAVFYFRAFDFEKLSDFQVYDEVMRDALADLRPDKNDFYRIEKTFAHDFNDGMRFQYGSLSHFNSTYENDTLDFLSRLGFACTQGTSYGGNATKFTDALFGVRYYIVPNEEMETPLSETLQPFPFHSQRPDVTNMEKVKETPNLIIYENPWSMPFGLLAEEDLSKYQIQQKNPMDLQDDIANLLDGKTNKTNYFIRQPLEEPELQNLLEQPNPIGLRQFVRTGSREDTARLNYTVQTTGEGSSYLTISQTFNEDNSTFYMNDEKLPIYRNETVDNSRILNIQAANKSPKTQKFSVEMTRDTDLFTLNSMALFELNEEALKEEVSFQNKLGLTLTEFQSMHLKGTFEAMENTPYLLLSLPYDPNWTATVDGEEVTPIKVFDALTAIAVTPGKHTIEMNFHIPMFLPGVIIMGIGLFGFVLVLRSYRGAKSESSNRSNRKKG